MELSRYQDQMGRKLEFKQTPKKVVSLVPSITEFLFDLDLVPLGVTKFCVHPDDARKRSEVIGGTKNPKIDRILSLQPDLIIANKEENRQEDIEALSEHCPVYVSDVPTVESALEMMLALGEILERSPKSQVICDKIQSNWDQIPQNKEKTVVYLIWKDPYMTAGNDTYIHDVIHRLSWKNAITSPRYPQISLEELEAIRPDLVLLSSEPFPFKEKHIAELSEMLPQSKVILVDGEAFSWYGSRMLPAVEYFSKLHREVI